MPVARGELKGKILRLLMKTPDFPGPYNDDTINDAIEEATDFVAMEMFEANEGWLTQLRYFDTVANQILVPIPEGVAMIQDVRYKYADIYVPLLYDDASKEYQYGEDSGAVQQPGSYRIIDNSIYFNPPLAQGGTNALQLECMVYPKRIQDDTDYLDSHFDYAMQNFIKYRSATILAAGLEKFATSWAGLESDWYQKMRNIIVKRNKQSVPIRDFMGF